MSDCDGHKWFVGLCIECGIIDPASGMAGSITEYVEREGSCTVARIFLIDPDLLPRVYKVEVAAFADHWQFPPPPYWLVCVDPATNMYRGDAYLPEPWLAPCEQPLQMQADFIRSTHTGILMRLSDGGAGQVVHRCGVPPVHIDLDEKATL